MGNSHNRASIGPTECKGKILRGPLSKPVLFPKLFKVSFFLNLLQTAKIAG